MGVEGAPPVSYLTSISQSSPGGCSILLKVGWTIVGFVVVNVYSPFETKLPSPTTRSPAGNWSVHPCFCVQSMGRDDLRTPRAIEGFAVSVWLTSFEPRGDGVPLSQIRKRRNEALASVAVAGLAPVVNMRPEPKVTMYR